MYRPELQITPELMGLALPEVEALARGEATGAPVTDGRRIS